MPPAAAQAAVANVERPYVTWKGALRGDDTLKLVQPLGRSLASGKALDPIVLLVAGAGLVLLITCANIMSLMLIRESSQRHTTAIRSLLGAPWRTVASLALREYLILAVLGIACAVVVAVWLNHVTLALLPNALRVLSPPRLDVRVLAFMIALTLVSVVLCALPAIRNSRRLDLAAMVASGGGHSATVRHGSRLRDAFVIFEISVAVVLTIATVLVLGSLGRMLATDKGFNPEGVGTARLRFAASSAPAVRNQLVRDVVIGMSRQPNVTAAAVDVLPLSGVGVFGQEVASDFLQVDDRKPMALRFGVTPGYFQTMGIPVLAGHDFAWAADSATAEAVITASLATKLRCGTACVGQRVYVYNQPRTIVGVVANVRTRALGDSVSDQVYLPLDESQAGEVAFVAKAGRSANEAEGLLATAMRSADPRQALFDVQSMEDRLSSSVAPRRLTTLLIAGFGAIAFLLAAAGVYATQAYSTQQSYREFAIRMALGAQSSELAAAVVRRSAVVGLAGLMLGGGAAYLLSRYIESQLYGTTAHDPAAYALSDAMILAVVILATLAPAWRVLRLPPALAMRQDSDVS